MNCNVAKRRLMSGTNPDRVSAEIRAHLAECEACGDWHNHLVQLERHVPFVPIPPSKGKARLLRQLLKELVPADTQDATAAATVSVAAAQTVSQLPRCGLTRSRATAAGLAAAVLVVVLVGWLVHARRLASAALLSHAPSADALPASLLQRDQRLAGAGTPSERLEILADLAEDLREQTQMLASSATGDQLTALAELYEQVVREGILKQAQSLPAADRPRVLGPIAERLDHAASQIEQMSHGVPPEYSKPLQTIAAAAQDGYSGLRALLPETRA
jgi:hypothetical protein